ncbi:glycogen debranching protein GlgX [Longitalea arenae]|uniref:glycogen debranching protein GlgX n=1 Tax=Longitalea arenae TaxID=2812558 RepID=UPI001967F22F|nr:glycogen debranching protein GlgX [Longitalea arenae]
MIAENKTITHPAAGGLLTGIYPGTAFPLGATYDGNGVNFSIYSEHAEEMELCLFENLDSKTEFLKIKMKEREHHHWHVYVADLKPGQLYGYRASGPFDPANGQRFNANKLLLDPYAKAISGIIDWHDSVFGYRVGEDDLTYNATDSAPYVPRSVVIDPTFDWENVQKPKIPYDQSVIYELHVKEFTQMNPEVPEELRGTYAGLAHPAVIDYLKQLGVTAIELMPVHHFVADRHLVESGLTNFWGYNTIGFFAPDVRYSSSGVKGEQVIEFKNMVKAMHKAGIEVILDVVYNHTAEGNHMGPTLSFKGIDNEAYYRLTEDKRYYMDYTGTGNTLNAYLPGVLRLIMDSLRYWTVEMQVDGFRFDLAATLARELHDVNRLSAFFEIIYQDPVISQVKLIAEPWDIGEGGYQVGKFPPGWAEWNGKYRDCMRDYWRGGDSMLTEFAERFTGSADLYKNDYRFPTASINFITAHDGFTLHDLVSYNEKHNEANGEGNNDGESHNRSWNCGAEGPTEDEAINKLRAQQKRNLLTTLLLSQGVPMLLSGDEICRTKNGNNNTYCQDNEMSWINWQKGDMKMLEFTRQLIHWRRNHPVFCRRRWFRGHLIKEINLKDIEWFSPDGTELKDDAYNSETARALAVYLNGADLDMTSAKGQKIVDDNFYVIFNGTPDPLEYKLPPVNYADSWIEVINTTKDTITPEGTRYDPGDVITAAGRSIILLHNPVIY